MVAEQDSINSFPEYTRSTFLPTFRKAWRQGEHVSIIGPTGTGKTTLSRYLLQARHFVTVLAVKKRDDTLDIFREARDGLPKFSIISKWPPRFGSRHVVLNLPSEGLSREKAVLQRANVLDCLEDIYDSGGWCISFDDLSYVCSVLHLREEIKVFLNTGRSNGISAVSLVTRPFQVPTEAFNQTTWSFMFTFEDRRETDRAAELAGVDYRDMRDIQKMLRPLDFVVHKRGTPGVMIVRNDAHGH